MSRAIKARNEAKCPPLANSVGTAHCVTCIDQATVAGDGSQHGQRRADREHGEGARPEGGANHGRNSSGEIAENCHCRVKDAADPDVVAADPGHGRCHHGHHDANGNVHEERDHQGQYDVSTWRGTECVEDAECQGCSNGS